MPAAPVIEQFVPPSHSPPSIQHENLQEKLPAPLPIEKKVVPSADPTSTFLKAKEKTWIDVRDLSGKIIVRRLLRTGQVYEFKHPENLVLKVGNAKGIQITSGEKTLVFPDAQGVKSGISLNSNNWN